jgi:phytoene/squalene synthetase
MMEHNPDVVSVKLSDFICTGLQLANHWQDIERDRNVGRCYIPREIAERFHVDLDNLSENDNFREMLRFLTDDARQRLETGRPLVYVVPQCYRNDIKLFIEGGLAILDATRRCGYNVLSSRPTVSRWTKIKLLLKALYSR